MQISPTKLFKTQKSALSPQKLAEPNSNERYIQHRLNYPQISNFQCHDNMDIDWSLSSSYSTLIHQSIFSTKNTYLFQNSSSSNSSVNRRFISKPYKILDAPDLQDNFYYSVLDWSSNNQIAVALSTQVYIFNASTSNVFNLFRNSFNVTSVRFSYNSQYLVIGLESGEIIIFDINKQEEVTRFQNHNGRVGSLRWKEWIISSGGYDTFLIHSDFRAPGNFFKIKAHSEEICGIEWNDDTIATGSNDNTVKLWENFNTIPSVTLRGHKSAIKSMAWSPYESKVLLTGGGACDKKIKIWNTINGNCISEVDTGSQVCNIIFSKHSKEFVSGHGYSRNEIIIWNYPEMNKLASMIGHDERVMYMASSPNGNDIITGAGDKTLRFWKIFESNKHEEIIDREFFENMR